MAYVDPTVAVFQVDFPEFEDTDSDVVTRFIAIAKRMVDQSWTEGDYTRAIELYVAHLLAVADAAAASGGGAGAGDIASESLGPVSVSYVKSGAAISDPFALMSTVYGKEFALLQRLNRGGPRII